MIFKGLKARLIDAEERLAFIEGELYEIKNSLKKEYIMENRITSPDTGSMKALGPVKTLAP